MNGRLIMKTLIRLSALAIVFATCTPLAATHEEDYQHKSDVFLANALKGKNQFVNLTILSLGSLIGQMGLLQKPAVLKKEPQLCSILQRTGLYIGTFGACLYLMKEYNVSLNMTTTWTDIKQALWHYPWH